MSPPRRCVRRPHRAPLVRPPIRVRFAGIAGNRPRHTPSGAFGDVRRNGYGGSVHLAREPVSLGLREGGRESVGAFGDIEGLVVHTEFAVVVHECTATRPGAPMKQSRSSYVLRNTYYSSLASHLQTTVPGTLRRNDR